MWGRDPNPGRRDPPAEPVITASLLLAAGYSVFHDPFNAALMGAAYQNSFQLRFYDRLGIRYVIAVHHGFAPPHPDWRAGHFYSPVVQFTRDGRRFTVELLPRGETVGALEAFILELWQTMRLDYFEGPEGQPCYPQPAR